MKELIINLNIISLQDSLQNLASLPLNELQEKINQIIRSEEEKEQEKRDAERIRKQNMYENNRYNNRNNQCTCDFYEC